MSRGTRYDFKGPITREQVDAYPLAREIGGEIDLSDGGFDDALRKLRAADYHAGLCKGWGLAWWAVCAMHGRPRGKTLLKHIKSNVLANGIRLGVITVERGQELMEKNLDPNEVEDDG